MAMANCCIRTVVPTAIPNGAKSHAATLAYTLHMLIVRSSSIKQISWRDLPGVSTILPI
jgi:hypothetical protein